MKTSGQEPYYKRDIVLCIVLSIAQILSCEFFEIFKSTSFYRTPLGNCFYTYLAHCYCIIKTKLEM